MGHLECAVVHHSHVIYPRACAGSSNGVVMSATNSSQLILPEVLPTPHHFSSPFFSQVVRRLMLHAWPGVTSGELFHVIHIWRLFFNKELSVLFLVVFECLGCCKQVGTSISVGFWNSEFSGKLHFFHHLNRISIKNKTKFKPFFGLRDTSVYLRLEWLLKEVPLMHWFGGPKCSRRCRWNHQF